MQNRRSIFLINPKFQLKTAFFISSLVFILSLLYPLTIYELFEQLTLQANSPEVVKIFVKERSFLILLLALYQLGFFFIIFGISIFQGHKIAGPLWQLNQKLYQIKNGQPVEKISFRKHDHFKELAESVNGLLDYFQNEHIKDFAYLSEVSEYLKDLSSNAPKEKKDILVKVTSKLEEIQKKFKPL